MKLKSVVCGTAVAALLLAGCDRRKDEPPPVPDPQSVPATGVAKTAAGESHLPPGIDWFGGDLDAAFAAARKADKPVFLYWGAEWCPPCAQIKTTIFSKREFQERSRLFVPVYLDGDTPSAQMYGERFGVIGYPTMILFKPDGTEITRLPGGVDVARYARILDVALADARPVSDILAAAGSGGAITSNDWKLLAYYSWSTDAGHVLPADRQLATFRALANRCPAELPAECARFFFAYLGAAADVSELGLNRHADGAGGAHDQLRLDDVLFQRQLRAVEHHVGETERYGPDALLEARAMIQHQRNGHFG